MEVSVLECPSPHGCLPAHKILFMSVAVQAFAPESPDRSRHSMGSVRAHPLPTGHTQAPAPIAPAQEVPNKTVGIIEAHPLPARHTTLPVSDEAWPPLPEQRAQGVGFVEAKPLPARHTIAASPANGADKVGVWTLLCLGINYWILQPS